MGFINQHPHHVWGHHPVWSSTIHITGPHHGPMGLQFDELGVIRNKQLTRLLPRWDAADKQLQW